MKRKHKVLAKKVSTYALIVTLFTSMISSVSMADDALGTSSNSKDTFTTSSGVSDTDSVDIDSLSIDELYGLRGQMALNYDENSSVIEAIDGRLEELGVEDLSQSEVDVLFDNCTYANGTGVQARVDINPSSTVTWSTYREVYVYRGVSYQLQYVIGVPQNGNSELIITDDIGSTTLYNVSTSSKTAINVTTSTYYSNPMTVTGDISTPVTLTEVLSQVTNSVPSFIQQLTLQYDLTLSTTFKYVFVKYDGATDTGNQVLAYEGTSTEYSCDVILANASFSLTKYGVEVTGTINSTYYSDCKASAAECFRQYREEGNLEYPSRFRLISITHTSLKETLKYSIDTPLGGF